MSITRCGSPRSLHSTSAPAAPPSSPDAAPAPRPGSSCCLNRHTAAAEPVHERAAQSVPLSRFDFRCEAYNDCTVGSLSWNDFNGITVHSSESAFKRFHDNDLQQWYRLLLRSSSVLNLGLHERIAITLLELSSEFGIKDSRGMLLRASFSHRDIADLVGASRPRVTEHLAQFELENLVIRQGRQLIVRVDEIEHSKELAYN